MLLTEVVYGKAYWEIRFEDIPEWWVLGVKCGCCFHKARIDRDRLQRRCKGGFVRFGTKYCRCTKCGNTELHELYVAGKIAR